MSEGESILEDPTLSAYRDALSDPKTFPEDASAVPDLTRIDTHISHLALSGERVYKLRRPVRFGFVDFSGRKERFQDCVRETQLNRRLAPNTYLGIAPLEKTGVPAQIRLGPLVADVDQIEVEKGLESEWVTVMRRLPDGWDATSKLRREELTHRDIAGVARHLAEFHRSGALVDSPCGDLSDLLRPAQENAQELRAILGQRFRSGTKSLETQMAAFEGQRAHTFLARNKAGCWVDGHGDLRLEHIWLQPGSLPEIIDCIEFSDRLRHIDRACDVAFLSMDLRFRDAHELAEHFLSSYAAHQDDYGLYRVLPYYEAYRAAVRAKVEAIAQGSEADREDVGAIWRYLRLAGRVLRDSPKGQLLITCGISGSGKSTVAERFAETLPAVIIRSDWIRKQRLGRPIEEALDPSFYTGEEKDAVYQALLERALPVLESGRDVILDASYSQRGWRDRLRDWSAELGLDAWLIEVQCPVATARARLERRRRAGPNASDAGPELLDRQVSTFDPPSEWTEGRVTIDTTTSDWKDAVDGFCTRFRAAGLLAA